MKVKIKETTNTVSPKYVYWENKNVFTLRIQDLYKYTVLYSANQIPVIPQIIIFSQVPQIQNYSKYTIFSSQTIGHTFGCQTVFVAPNYVFPSWDEQISQTPGITFGKITLNEFFTLTGLPGVTNPNQNLLCS